MRKNKNTNTRKWLLIFIVCISVFMFGKNAWALVWPIIGTHGEVIGAFLWEIIRYVLPIAFIIFAVWIARKIDRDVRRIKRDTR